MSKKETARLRELAPRDEIALLVMEATASVERTLALEDAGWMSLSSTTDDVISGDERITNVKLSRLFAAKDPLGKQAIRLWTDYTFGIGMTLHAPKEGKATEESKTEEVRKAFWESKDNRSVLSARGQRISSDKLLIDGEVPFAIFLGAEGKAKIRRINPLEITDIITDPDDKEDVLFYRRQWSDAAGATQDKLYRSATNPKAKEPEGKEVEDALIYFLTYNTISQRGNPLLLPALVWMKYHTLQLASYIAVDIAQSKFVLRSKVKGGQAAVDAIKAKTEGKQVKAGSTLIENLGVDTEPFKIDARAKNAYEGSRLTRLQFCAAVGIPEQYFGDIATGNLATAKTVELPMMKMFQSYQAVWADAYKDINEIIFEHNEIPEDKRYVDLDFPKIAPADIAQAAVALGQILQVIPQLGDSDDVKQIALMTLGVNDPAEVLDELTKEIESNPDAAIARELKHLREAILNKEKKE